MNHPLVEGLYWEIVHSSISSDNSHTFRAFSSWIDELKRRFPSYNFSHIYSDYYMVYFKKKIKVEIEYDLEEDRTMYKTLVRNCEERMMNYKREMERIHKEKVDDPGYKDLIREMLNTEKVRHKELVKMMEYLNAGIDTAGYYFHEIYLPKLKKGGTDEGKVKG